jgi:hypothetical protein
MRTHAMACAVSQPINSVCLQEGFNFGLGPGCHWDPDGAGACKLDGCQCGPMREALMWPPGVPMLKLNGTNYPLNANQGECFLKHYKDRGVSSAQHACNRWVPHGPSGTRLLPATAFGMFVGVYLIYLSMFVGVWPTPAAALCTGSSPPPPPLAV